MPANKNQHFVPKFYFRLFSNDGKQIEIFNKYKNLFIWGSIKGQCSYDYFYGKDLELEKADAAFESLVSTIIKNVISKGSLECLNDEELFIILTFTMFQYSRTNCMKKKQDLLIDTMYDNLWKPILKQKISNEKYNLDPRFIDKYKLKIEGSHNMSMIMGLTSIISISDLNYLLLVNKTKKDFIFSDAPVILHNSAFNKLKNIGTCGLASKGLQIFYPLNNRFMLMLYDPDSYFITSSNKLNFFIRKDKDVNSLNTLQYFYSDRNVYYTSNLQKHYIEKLYKSISEKLIENKIDILIYKNKANPLNELHQFSNKNIDYNLSLTFLKVKSELQYGNGIRNSSNYELQSSFVDEIIKQNKLNNK